MKAVLACMAAFALCLSITAALGQEDVEPMARTQVTPKMYQDFWVEYPAQARRYELEGQVIIDANLDALGRPVQLRVRKSSADVFERAVLERTRFFRFDPPPAPGWYGSYVVDFRLHEPGTNKLLLYDVSPRPIKFAPQRAQQVRGRLIDGWSTVRLLINREGIVDPIILPIRSSSPEFLPTLTAITKSLRFAAVDADPNSFKASTLNDFYIEVIDRTQIFISQFPAD